MSVSINKIPLISVIIVFMLIKLNTALMINSNNSNDSNSIKNNQNQNNDVLVDNKDFKCPKYTCSSFSNKNICVKKSNTGYEFSNICGNKSYCPYLSTSLKSPESECKDFVSDDKYYRYLGSYCLNNKQCPKSSSCINNICVSLKSTNECSSHRDCEIGMTCMSEKEIEKSHRNNNNNKDNDDKDDIKPTGSNKICIPQQLENAYCSEDYHCINTHGCLNNKCTPYFSLQDTQTIPSNNTTNTKSDSFYSFCSSTFAYQNICTTIRLKQKNTSCSKTHECVYSSNINNSNSIKNSDIVLPNCDCGYSQDMYCKYGNGDVDIETYKNLIMGILLGNSNCHTEERDFCAYIYENNYSDFLKIVKVLKETFNSHLFYKSEWCVKSIVYPNKNITNKLVCPVLECTNKHELDNLLVNDISLLSESNVLDKEKLYSNINTDTTSSSHNSFSSIINVDLNTITNIIDKRNQEINDLKYNNDKNFSYYSAENKKQPCVYISKTEENKIYIAECPKHTFCKYEEYYFNSIFYGDYVAYCESKQKELFFPGESCSLDSDCVAISSTIAGSCLNKKCNGVKEGFECNSNLSCEAGYYCGVLEDNDGNSENSGNKDTYSRYDNLSKHIYDNFCINNIDDCFNTSGKQSGTYNNKSNIGNKDTPLIRSTCLPQKDYSQTCSDSYQCKNNLFCYYNICFPLFSLPKGEVIKSYSKEFQPYLCESGFSYHGVCAEMSYKEEEKSEYGILTCEIGSNCEYLIDMEKEDYNINNNNSKKDKESQYISYTTTYTEPCKCGFNGYQLSYCSFSTSNPYNKDKRKLYINSRHNAFINNYHTLHRFKIPLEIRNDIRIKEKELNSRFFNPVYCAFNILNDQSSGVINLENYSHWFLMIVFTIFFLL